MWDGFLHHPIAILFIKLARGIVVSSMVQKRRKIIFGSSESNWEIEEGANVQMQAVGRWHAKNEERCVNACVEYWNNNGYHHCYLLAIGRQIIIYMHEFDFHFVFGMVFIWNENMHSYFIWGCVPKIVGKSWIVWTT